MLYQEGCRKIPVQWLRTGRATPGYHVHGSPTMENLTKTILVVSAHAADFVWRAGGAIALYASRGYKVRILCLSYGERGESQGAWKQPGMTVDKVKAIRHAESSRAAELLCAEIRFFDSGDYPIK